MKVGRLVRQYRKSINPPYSRKDALTILATLFILIAIPLTVISVFRSEEINKNPKAASTFTLGMNMFAIDDTTAFDSYVDDLLAHGITNMRIGRNYYETTEARSKDAAIRMVKKGVKVTWLVSSDNTP